jgi:putative endonuclease
MTQDKIVKPQWYVYMLRCADNSLYTGVTTDIVRREREHNGKTASVAKYTRTRQPVKMVYHEQAENRSAACQREAAIKKLRKSNKEALVNANQKLAVKLDHVTSTTSTEALIDK